MAIEKTGEMPGEIQDDLEVKEVSFVGNPALPMAKFVIVKQADSEDTENQDEEPEEVLLTKETIEKSPVPTNFQQPATPTVEDATRAEVQSTIREIVGKAGDLTPELKSLITKVANYHGVEGLSPETAPQMSVDDLVMGKLDSILGLVERFANIASTMSQAATPAAPKASSGGVSKEGGEASSASAEPVTETVASVSEPAVADVVETVTEAVSEATVEPHVEEIAKSVEEQDIFTQAVALMQKRLVKSKEQVVVNAVEQLTASKQRLLEQYTEVRRSLLKAMGRDPASDA